MPWTGLVLVYEWTFTIFFLLFGVFLLFVHQHGKRIAIQSESSSLDDSAKGMDMRRKQQIVIIGNRTILYKVGN
jgi:hypothetical protein